MIAIKLEKSSEQLRSRSIDGSCQMVRTGSQKYEKSQYVFGFLGWNIDALLLTHDFLMFSCPRRFWKLQFRSPKLIFGEILIKNIFFWIFIILVFDFFVFFSTFIFWFFWHLQISLKISFFDNDFLCFCSILVPKSSPSPLYNLLG